MLAVSFEFPAHRYHATPWGRNVNEADVAWPPEPIRILRALVATWHRKADSGIYPKSQLDRLIDCLASDLPAFALPAAVHTHVRAFMPAPVGKRLIYDAFLCLEPDAELVALWPAAELDPRLRALCAHLFERMGYLGRAESWVQARVLEAWKGDLNARPRPPGGEAPPATEPIGLNAPVAPAEWVSRRPELEAAVNRLRGSKRRRAQVALSERLSDAIAVDTSDWQAGGWSTPPPLRTVLYDRPPLTPVPTVQRKRPLPSGPPGREEVARYVLAGRPAPRIEDTLRIGELVRLALMAGGSNVPPELSGRGPHGPLRHDGPHEHAFFLPEDADGDGSVDHVVVYCPTGFSPEGLRRLDRLHALWLRRAGADEDRGRQEWRVALEAIASPETFADASPLLRRADTWVSCTPYLRPWFAKPGFGVPEQVSREAEERGMPPVEVLSAHGRDLTERSRRALDFKRIRMRRGLVQPDKIGTFLAVRFAVPVRGPVALGFGCHFGLGLFRPLSA